MLVSQEGLSNPIEEHTEISIGEATVFCSGLFFYRGLPEGEQSLKVLLERYRTGAELEFDMMHGAFVVVLSEPTRPVLAFADNSAMRGLLVTDQYLGDDIVELALVSGKTTLDHEAICQYLSLTRGFSLNTVIKGITTSDHLSFYTVDPDGVHEHPKGIDGPDGRSTITDPVVFFRSIISSIENKRIVGALTAGYDSRMVVALFNQLHGHKIPTAISGNPKSQEVTKAKKTSTIAGNTLTIVNPEKPTLDISYFKFIRKFQKGHLVNYDASGYRLATFRQKLRDEGHELLVDGESGAAHKDTWFLQDFPLYRSPRTRTDRFYDLRMEPIVYKDFLGVRTLHFYETQRQRALELLGQYQKPINTQSYDLFGWHVSWASTVEARLKPSPMLNYSPLQELALVRYSYHLPRRMRSFNLFQRIITSKADPEMAKTTTSLGTTASTALPYVIRDVFAQVLALTKTGLGLLSRKILGRNIIQKSVLEWDLASELKQSPEANRAVRWARDEGILTEEMGAQTLPVTLINKVINLHRVYDLVMERGLEHSEDA